MADERSSGEETGGQRLLAAERDELSRFRRQARDRRERLIVLSGLLLSLLLHGVITLGGHYWSARLPAEPPPEPPKTARIRFIETPEAPPPEQPPETTNISERDQRASSSKPSEGEANEPDQIVPVPQVQRRASRPAEQQEPPQPEEEEPEEREREPRVDSRTLQRRRLSEALQRVRSAPVPENYSQPAGGRGGASQLGQPMFESNADVDWGPYYARIKPIVSNNWRIPVAVKLGVSGVVRLHFYIACDGSIEELEYSYQDKTLALNQAAFDALRLSDRLPPPPLPPEFCEERVGILWTFNYLLNENELRMWYRDRAIEQRRAR